MSLGFPSSGPLPFSYQVDPQPTSSNEGLLDKIKSIDNTHIEWIADKITRTICSRLGPTGKAEVEKLVRAQTGEELDLSESFAQFLAPFAEKRTAIFLSQFKDGEFAALLLSKIQKLLTEHFSTPLFFVNQGITFSISCSETPSFISAIAEQAAIMLLKSDIPCAYSVRFHILLNETGHKSALVFSLLEFSGSTQFAASTFTLEDLENA